MQEWQRKPRRIVRYGNGTCGHARNSAQFSVQVDPATAPADAAAASTLLRGVKVKTNGRGERRKYDGWGGNQGEVRSRFRTAHYVPEEK